MTDVKSAARAFRTIRLVRAPPRLVLLVLAMLMAMIIAVSLSLGAAGIPMARLPAAAFPGIWPSADVLTGRDQMILWSIRAPRIALAVLIGAMLAFSGALMQGLFRNPLADPALVGVSSGGALAAATTIVLMDSRVGHAPAIPPSLLLPLAAFCGSLVATFVLYRLASRGGRTSIAMFLLAGLALAAICNAMIGCLVFVADDRQLRDITFWLLGSMAGASWPKAAVAAVTLALGLIACRGIVRGLDLLALGEAEAFHGGTDVERLKLIATIVISLMTGVAVSMCGVVGFVGIIVPHLLRILIGPSHQLLLPASGLVGGALLVGADTFARTLVAPAEMPIGILTALLGAPVFLAILMRQRGLALA